jgi:hypothetical protein
MNPHEDEALDLAHLREEIHQLERRVEALEHPDRSALFPAAEPAVPQAVPDTGFGTAVPAIGRAVLGLAGAYLLRAAAESGITPRLLTVLAGVLYAGVWLFLAIRARHTSAVAGVIYSVTSATILAPLLWEATVRFDVMPTLATAAVLIAFGALSFAAPVIAPAATVTAIALMIRTGDLVPFVAALLVAAALVEADVSRGHRNFMRVPAALAADFGIWVLIYIMGSPGGVPSTYKPVPEATSVALCAGLFLVFAVGIAWRSVLLRHTASWFEVGQATLAFLLAAWGTLQLTGGRFAAPLGILCAICCAKCYFAAFARSGDSVRNHRVFASWGLALGLTACILTLPESLLTPLWSAAAVIATLAGVRAAQPTLALHGTLLLLAAATTSGIPQMLFNAFAGSVLEPAAPALAILALAALCCCFASLVAAVLAGLSLGALAILIAGPSAAMLATARTLAISALALVFAWIGSRTGRRELVWIGYACIALGTLKLVLEDFRSSSAAALAVSLVCYGGLLILVPRLSATAAK